jgi:hypothetical protein
LKQLLLDVFAMMGNSCLLSLCHFCVVYSVHYYELHHQIRCSLFIRLSVHSLIRLSAHNLIRLSVKSLIRLSVHSLIKHIILEIKR